MKSVLKYLLYAVAGVVVVLAAIAAYVAATFDPADYKARIAALVKERTDRTLTIAGDVDLSLFPNVGAELGKVTLSEPGSERRFASIEHARISLALLPLFSRKAVVDAVELRGVRAEVVVRKDGTTSVDDLTGGKAADAGSPGAPSPGPAPGAGGGDFELDVARVRLEDVSVALRDERSGARYAVTGLDLSTGRLVLGKPSAIELSGRFEASDPPVAVDAKLQTRLAIDWLKGSYALEELTATLAGDALGWKAFTATLAATLRGERGATAIAIEGLKFGLAGTRDGEKIDLQLETPRVAASPAKVDAGSVSLQARLTRAAGPVSVSLAVASVRGDAKSVNLESATVTLDAKQDDAAVKARLTGPVRVALDGGPRIELPEFSTQLDVAAPALPGGKLQAQLAGSAAADPARASARVDFKGRIDQSNVAGKLNATRFEPPAFTFDVSIDTLDLDRYTGGNSRVKPAPGKTAAAPAPKPSAPAAGAKAAEQPLDLSALAALGNASGTLRVDSLTASGIKARNVRLVVKGANKAVRVEPISADLYGGTLAGSLALDGSGKSPRVALRQTLTNVDVGPLLRDLADKDMLEGRGVVRVDVTSSGATVPALERALAGTAAIQLKDGAIKGINVAKTLREVKAALGSARGQQARSATAAEKTDFSELSASFRIRDGIARNDDLSMKSPLLRVSGNGSIDIPARSIDYLAKVAIVATSTGQGGRDLADLNGVTVPVRLRGPFDALAYSVDADALVAELAKSQVRKQVEGVTKRLEERLAPGLGDQLRNFFRR